MSTLREEGRLRLLRLGEHTGAHSSKLSNSPGVAARPVSPGQSGSRTREGTLEEEGGAHQDVSLQEQTWFNGDTDASLAVSGDVAEGERQ